MNKVAVFPGTFDPFTNGHLDIVKRGLLLFDEIIIGIGKNTSKQSMFSLDQRMFSIGKVFEDTPEVSVQQYQGLTVDFCNQSRAQFLLRGLRNSVDFVPKAVKRSYRLRWLLESDKLVTLSQ